MKIKPYPGAGVEITDVDLRTVDDESIETIRALFIEHGLVFFRGQDLSEDDHVALAERFGTININRFFPQNTPHPEVAIVAKEPEDRVNIGGIWHADHSYDVEPALGSILIPRLLPDSGGDTWFVSMYDAFDRLPAAMKSKLRRMKAIHSSKHIFGSRGAILRRLLGAKKHDHPEVADAIADVAHPVVIRHPLSGREALFINPTFTIGFEDQSLLRSLPLLAYLYVHATRPAYVAKFEWDPGSVAFWDNRATWHYAQNDYPGQRRVMHRVTLDGCALNSSIAI